MGEIKTAKHVREAAQGRADNWVNMVNGLGDVSRDRTAAVRFASNSQINPAYWETIFAEDPIGHRMAALPAREMLRQGFRLDLGDTGGELQAPVMADYDRLSASSIMIEAMALGRALGGAAVFIGADDDRPLEMPLDLARVRKVNFLKVLTRRDLTPQRWYSDPLKDEKFGQPETYDMQVQTNGGPGANAKITVHESRLLLFEGVVTTAQRRALQQGWGDSIYVQTEQALSTLWQGVSGLANALSDADQGVFKLEGLLDILRSGAEGDEAIRRRLSLLQHGRSVARAIALDAKSEDFEYISRSFTGYDSGLYALMYILSAACGIPVTLLFGRSPAGLNSTGESDITFFYDSIKSEQELRLMKPLRRLLEIIFAAKEGPAKGKIPKEWGITFRPLTQSTPLERAEIRLKTAQADQIEIDLGVISESEAATSHYGGDEYDQDITLDPDLDRDEVVDEAQPEPPTIVAAKPPFGGGKGAP